LNDLAALGGVSMVNPPALDLAQPCGLWLMSDLHVGASNTDYKRIAREVKSAVKRRDRVLINGDVFDAIISGDPRFQPSTLHPRLIGDGDDFPIDTAIEWAAELLQPAADAGLIDFVGHGNHETALQKRTGMSLLKSLRLRLGRANCPKPAGYCSFLNYRLTVGGQRAGRYVIFAHHGSKNGAGLGQMSRLASIADADLVWIGHFHNKQSTGRYSVAPSADGTRVEIRERRQVMTGGYTFAYGSNTPGKQVDRYASVTALPPGLVGGTRVALRWCGELEQVTAEVQS
jgi:hypothetical protein